MKNIIEQTIDWLDSIGLHEQRDSIVNAVFSHLIVFNDCDVVEIIDFGQTHPKAISFLSDGQLLATTDPIGFCEEIVKIADNFSLNKPVYTAC